MSPRGLDALLRLEDEAPDVLLTETSSSKVRVWPILRTPLTVELAADEFSTGLAAPTPSIARTSRRVRDRFTGEGLSRRLRGQRELLIVSSGATVRSTPAGPENWLENPLAKAFDGTSVIVQDLPLPASFRPHPDIAETYSFDDAMFRVDLSTRIRSLGRRDRGQVVEMAEAVFDQLDYPLRAERKQALISALLYRVARARHTRDAFDSLLRRVRPRIILMETAAYGGRSVFVEAARQRGIPVLEPQHGWIGAAHGAYNYGAAMQAEPLRGYLPDALLTFGDYWSEGLRFPAPSYPIGKPFLEESARTAREDQSDDLLVVSSVVNAEEITRITLRLAERFRGRRRVLFRPHPAERPRLAELYPDLLSSDDVQIDVESDLYASLRRASAVFGYASTVLFEALAFRVPVFVIDSQLADYYAPIEVFGERISEGASLDASADLIDSGNGTWSDYPVERIWKPDGLRDFREIVARFL